MSRKDLIEAGLLPKEEKKPKEKKLFSKLNKGVLNPKVVQSTVGIGCKVESSVNPPVNTEIVDRVYVTGLPGDFTEEVTCL